MRDRLSIRDLVLVGLLSALLYAAQVLMAPLPGVEPVSLLIILFTLYFRSLTPYVIYTFVLLEGLTYGFHLWWICYLYVWLILHLAARALHANDSPLFWALVSGAFGLGFGALCSIPYLLAGGPAAAFAWFIAGIPHDLAHSVGNFAIMLALYRPIGRLFSRFGSRMPAC